MRKCIFYLALIVVLISCDKDDSVASPMDTLHEDYFSENIQPALNDFKIQIEKQIELSENFKLETTASNFNKLQDQWLNCAKAFSKTRVYNLVAVKAKYFDLHIYNFPINPDQIENNINEQTVYDSTYFTSKSTVSKGLGAVEFLFFNNQDPNLALLLFQKDTFRIHYLLGVSQEILRQTDLLINFWEQGYKETFLSARNVSCVENARCLAFNQLINVLDVIRVTKVGKPAGLENSSNASLESLEAYRSESSLALIRSSIEEVQYAYTLSHANFATIIEEISGSKVLTNEIDSAFQSVYSNIDAIDTSLYEAISTNNPRVELLYNSLFDLVKYFSVDAASILSVTVLPTDNDGD
ncbi:imelysin family protein [Tamlana agarivorans]|uniref:Imelysin family protein n=1 Tax=Pseudotamlana agarivorans TaxID=481183 RepID=A0ACC5U4F7_9FLAO|nr:imelysin family protein [Tamlana agarivorans]MBU2949200.1 imelysin family protein [Tamlana agarivorans]